jgi:acyl-CoA thioesterase I
LRALRDQNVDDVAVGKKAMRQRAIIKLAGCLAAVWPLVARAQQPAVPAVGFLNGASPGAYANRIRVFRRGVLLAVSMLLSVTAVGAEPLRIVAVGASNTSGWLIGKQSAYPAVLQRMLKAKGVDAQVVNAGVPFDTTSKMLARIDSAVPNGTDIVILQPGGNDLRFFGSKQQRAANIGAMMRRLRARSIKVIVYDEEIPWRYVFDGIHLTPAGHTMIATALLPKVMALVNRKPTSGRAQKP